MTEQAPDRVWSGIDIPKIIAAALAAVCAAVIGSFLGVAGTLVGAAVASVIGSVGTEVYHRYLNKGAKKIQTLAVPAFVRAPAAVGTPSVAAAAEEDSPSHTVPDLPQRQIRWGRVAIVAGALFVLAMGTLTVVELITGKSVASTVGNGTGAKTTFGGIFDPGTSTSTTPAPTPTPSDTTPANAIPTAKPTAKATTAPPLESTAQPTTAPTTAAPDDTAPADNSGQNVDPGQGGGQSATDSDQTGQSTP
jgi:hypothetical protein